MSRYTGAGALAALLIALPASAQICEGNPALGSNAAAVIGGGASFFDGGTAYSAGATFGDGVYGGGSFGLTDFDNSSYSQKRVGAGIGFDASDGASVSVCPSLSASYAFGLEIVGVDVTSWAIAPGVSMGFRSDVSETFAVVPGAGAAFIYEKANADAGIGGEYEDSRSYGALTASLTLLFNDRFGVTPRVNFPVGLDGADTTFGLGIGLAIGGN